MEPPAASARITERQVRGLGLLPVAAGRARPASPSGSACRPRTSPCTSRCSAAASAASRSPTSASRRRCCPRRWTASRSRSSGRATTICTTTTSTRSRSSTSKPASTRKGQAGRVAASQRRADDRVDLRCGCQAGGELGARHGRHQRALRHSQHPHRESGSDRAHAHRLVPLGVEHPARVRGAVVRRRAGAPRRGATRRTSCSR